MLFDELNDDVLIKGRSEPTFGDREEYKTVPISTKRLPVYLTRFFGRNLELIAIAKLCTENRLATIVGPGGIARTRIAIEVGARWEGGVAFAPLTACGDLLYILDVLQATFGTVKQTGTDVKAKLLDVIRNAGDTLLILDNAENLPEAIGQLSESILLQCPNIRLLITSRQPLGIPGEQIFRLGPLALPDALEKSATLALFLDRARRSRPDFSLKASNKPFIKEICLKLEGVPLAIEIAAAQK